MVKFPQAVGSIGLSILIVATCFCSASGKQTVILLLLS